MSYYVGITPSVIYNSIQSRFFYGMRRSENGELFVNKFDQLKKDDMLTINSPGDSAENYRDFEEGTDFFEGRTETGEKVYENLLYEQYRWDNKNIYYYVNDQGELVARVSKVYNYDNTVSSDG